MHQKHLLAVLLIQPKTQKVGRETCSAAFWLSFKMKSHKCEKSFDSIWSAGRLCTVDSQWLIPAIWRHNYLVRCADIAKLTLIPHLIRNNEIGWSSLTARRPFSRHQTGCLFEITLMKGALAKNRHVLLLEGGWGRATRRGGALTAFISINKMERFTRGPLLGALSGGRRESYTLTTSTRVHFTKRARGDSLQHLFSQRNLS